MSDISILITGNPSSSVGVTEIGKIGSGLDSIDPLWPQGAAGDFVVMITEENNASIYCMMFRSSLISASEGSRSGALNFQLRIPFGYAIIDAMGDLVSPFKFLQLLFQEYESKFLRKYPGVEGWTFRGDGKMSADELKSFNAPYKLIERKLPPRHLEGKGEAIIRLSVNDIEAVTLDYAYNELTRFNKLILCVKGSNSPENLKLQIPRIPTYGVYVNGRKQALSVKESDPPCTITVEAPKPYQESAKLKIDFAQAEKDGLVNRVDERIDYSLRFQDKTKEFEVKVKLTGCSDDEELRRKIINKILQNIDLKSDDREFFPIEKVNKGKSSKTFFLSGKSSVAPFTVEYRYLPENVSFVRCQDVVGGMEYTFNYQKPVAVRTFDSEREETLPLPGPSAKGTNRLKIYVYAPDAYYNEQNGMTIKVRLTSFNEDKLVQYNEVKCGKAKNDTAGRSRYVCELDVEAVDLNGATAKVFSSDRRWKFDVQDDAVKSTKEGYYVMVKASIVSPVQKWKPMVIKIIFLLMIFAIGFWAGKITYQPPTEQSDPTEQLTDSLEVVEEVVDTVDTILESDVNEPKQEEPTAQPGNTVDYDALTAQATEYINRCKAADLTFAEVAAIRKWLTDNYPYRVPIQGYNKLTQFIKTYESCIEQIKKIPQLRDDPKIPADLNEVVKNLPTDPEYLNLRSKMQKLNGGNNKNAVQVGTILAKFADQHSEGITSFTEI